MEVSSGPVKGLRRRPVLQLAALGQSRSCPHLCLCSALVLLPQEGRIALAESARTPKPSVLFVPPRSSGLSTVLSG